MTEQLALRFLENFSLLIVGENKVPLGAWKENQNTKLSIDEFTRRIKDSRATGIGIITGFEYLEVIDVDLKVFSTPAEMQDFWNEYLNTLQESIYDFDKKFTIYKTKSGGYHILYKTKRVEGNKKIASLQGHKEAVIESRGIGGYVFAYPENKVGNRSYFDIDFITDDDRQTLWNISKAYDYQEPQKEIKPKVKREFITEGKTPWQDFNEQNSVLDVVVPDDFEIPRGGEKSKHTLIKRHGAKSAHSGYVFKNNGCMYLFSTGTIYPHEKLISPFAAYTYKYHSGDFSAAARDLYEQGFGDRLKDKIKQIEPPPIKPTIPEIVPSEFPLEIFPDPIQVYIKETAEKLQMNIDYMGSSLLWLTSVICGNAIEIQVKSGWTENGVLWLALVGQAGVGKTPSIDRMIFPLQKINNKEIKKYLEAKQKFDEFSKLSKKEQEEIYGKNYKVFEPKKTQFIVNDITLEALVQMHQESDNAVGVFKDELAGWLKDMNKYRAGSDLEFWLSSWSGKSVNLNRKTASSSFVDKPFIPVLGGIQPNIFNNLSTEETKDNGFLDRLLLCYPDISINYYIESEIDSSLITWYREMITDFYNTINRSILKRVENEIEPVRLKMNIEAKAEWMRIFNKITDSQNNDSENQYLKSMYPKQKSYIPRFALLIHIIDQYFTGFQNLHEVGKTAILKAEKLSDYFVNAAKKVKIDATETTEIKQSMKNGQNTYDKIKAIWMIDKNFNKSKTADLLSVSRQYIYKVVNKLESESA
jgi:hypothetical protein